MSTQNTGHLYPISSQSNGSNDKSSRDHIASQSIEPSSIGSNAQQQEALLLFLREQQQQHYRSPPQRDSAPPGRAKPERGSSTVNSVALATGGYPYPSLQQGVPIPFNAWQQRPPSHRQSSYFSGAYVSGIPPLIQNTPGVPQVMYPTTVRSPSSLNARVAPNPSPLPVPSPPSLVSQPSQFPPSFAVETPNGSAETLKEMQWQLHQMQNQMMDLLRGNRPVGGSGSNNSYLPFPSNISSVASNSAGGIPAGSATMVGQSVPALYFTTPSLLSPHVRSGNISFTVGPPTPSRSTNDTPISSTSAGTLAPSTAILQVGSKGHQQRHRASLTPVSGVGVSSNAGFVPSAMVPPALLPMVTLPTTSPDTGEHPQEIPEVTSSGLNTPIMPRDETDVFRAGHASAPSTTASGQGAGTRAGNTTNNGATFFLVPSPPPPTATVMSAGPAMPASVDSKNGRQTNTPIPPRHLQTSLLEPNNEEVAGAKNMSPLHQNGSSGPAAFNLVTPGSPRVNSCTASLSDAKTSSGPGSGSLRPHAIPSHPEHPLHPAAIVLEKQQRRVEENKLHQLPNGKDARVDGGAQVDRGDHGTGTLQKMVSGDYVDVQANAEKRNSVDVPEKIQALSSDRSIHGEESRLAPSLPSFAAASAAQMEAFDNLRSAATTHLMQRLQLQQEIQHLQQRQKEPLGIVEKRIVEKNLKRLQNQLEDFTEAEQQQHKYQRELRILQHQLSQPAIAPSREHELESRVEKVQRLLETATAIREQQLLAFSLEKKQDSLQRQLRDLQESKESTTSKSTTNEKEALMHNLQQQLEDVRQGKKLAVLQEEQFRQELEVLQGPTKTPQGPDVPPLPTPTSQPEVLSPLPTPAPSHVPPGLSLTSHQQYLQKQMKDLHEMPTSTEKDIHQQLLQHHLQMMQAQHKLSDGEKKQLQDQFRQQIGSTVHSSDPSSITQSSTPLPSSQGTNTSFGPAPISFQPSQSPEFLRVPQFDSYLSSISANPSYEQYASALQQAMKREGGGRMVSSPIRSSRNVSRLNALTSSTQDQAITASMPLVVQGEDSSFFLSFPPDPPGAENPSPATISQHLQSFAASAIAAAAMGNGRFINRGMVTPIVVSPSSRNYLPSVSEGVVKQPSGEDFPGAFVMWGGDTNRRYSDNSQFSSQMPHQQQQQQVHLIMPGVEGNAVKHMRRIEKENPYIVKQFSDDVVQLSQVTIPTSVQEQLSDNNGGRNVVSNPETVDPKKAANVPPMPSCPLSCDPESPENSSVAVSTVHTVDDASERHSTYSVSTSSSSSASTQNKLLQRLLIHSMDQLRDLLSGQYQGIADLLRNAMLPRSDTATPETQSLINNSSTVGGTVKQLSTISVRRPSVDTTMTIGKDSIKSTAEAISATSKQSTGTAKQLMVRWLWHRQQSLQHQLLGNTTSEPEENRVQLIASDDDDVDTIPSARFEKMEKSEQTMKDKSEQIFVHTTASCLSPTSSMNSDERATNEHHRERLSRLRAETERKKKTYKPWNEDLTHSSVHEWSVRDDTDEADVHDLPQEITIISDSFSHHDDLEEPREEITASEMEVKEEERESIAVKVEVALKEAEKAMKEKIETQRSEIKALEEEILKNIEEKKRVKKEKKQRRETISKEQQRKKLNEIAEREKRIAALREEEIQRQQREKNVQQVSEATSPLHNNATLEIKALREQLQEQQLQLEDIRTMQHVIVDQHQQQSEKSPQPPSVVESQPSATPISPYPEPIFEEVVLKEEDPAFLPSSVPENVLLSPAPQQEALPSLGGAMVIPPALQGAYFTVGMTPSGETVPIVVCQSPTVPESPLSPFAVSSSNPTGNGTPRPGAVEQFMHVDIVICPADASLSIDPELAASQILFFCDVEVLITSVQSRSRELTSLSPLSSPRSLKSASDSSPPLVPSTGRAFTVERENGGQPSSTASQGGEAGGANPMQFFQGVNIVVVVNRETEGDQARFLGDGGKQVMEKPTMEFFTNVNAVLSPSTSVPTVVPSSEVKGNDNPASSCSDSLSDPKPINVVSRKSVPMDGTVYSSTPDVGSFVNSPVMTIPYERSVGELEQEDFEKSSMEVAGENKTETEQTQFQGVVNRIEENETDEVVVPKFPAPPATVLPVTPSAVAITESVAETQASSVVSIGKEGVSMEGEEGRTVRICIETRTVHLSGHPHSPERHHEKKQKVHNHRLNRHSSLSSESSEKRKRRMDSNLSSSSFSSSYSSCTSETSTASSSTRYSTLVQRDLSSIMRISVESVPSPRAGSPASPRSVSSNRSSSRWSPEAKPIGNTRVDIETIKGSPGNAEQGIPDTPTLTRITIRDEPALRDPATSSSQPMAEVHERIPVVETLEEHSTIPVSPPAVENTAISSGVHKSSRSELGESKRKKLKNKNSSEALTAGRKSLRSPTFPTITKQFQPEDMVKQESNAQVKAGSTGVEKGYELQAQASTLSELNFITAPIVDEMQLSVPSAAHGVVSGSDRQTPNDAALMSSSSVPEGTGKRSESVESTERLKRQLSSASNENSSTALPGKLSSSAILAKIERKQQELEVKRRLQEKRMERVKNKMMGVTKLNSLSSNGEVVQHENESEDGRESAETVCLNASADTHPMNESILRMLESTSSSSSSTSPTSLPSSTLTSSRFGSFASTTASSISHRSSVAEVPHSATSVEKKELKQALDALETKSIPPPPPVISSKHQKHRKHAKHSQNKDGLLKEENAESSPVSAHPPDEEPSSSLAIHNSKESSAADRKEMKREKKAISDVPAISTVSRDEEHKTKSKSKHRHGKKSDNRKSKEGNGIDGHANSPVFGQPDLERPVVKNHRSYLRETGTETRIEVSSPRFPSALPGITNSAGGLEASSEQNSTAPSLSTPPQEITVVQSPKGDTSKISFIQPQGVPSGVTVELITHYEKEQRKHSGSRRHHSKPENVVHNRNDPKEESIVKRTTEDRHSTPHVEEARRSPSPLKQLPKNEKVKNNRPKKDKEDTETLPLKNSLILSVPKVESRVSYCERETSPLSLASSHSDSPPSSPIRIHVATSTNERIPNKQRGSNDTTRTFHDLKKSKREKRDAETQVEHSISPVCSHKVKADKKSSSPPSQSEDVETTTTVIRRTRRRHLPSEECSDGAQSAEDAVYTSIVKSSSSDDAEESMFDDPFHIPVTSQGEPLLLSSGGRLNISTERTDVQKQEHVVTPTPAKPHSSLSSRHKSHHHHRRSSSSSACSHPSCASCSDCSGIEIMDTSLKRGKHCHHKTHRGGIEVFQVQPTRPPISTPEHCKRVKLPKKVSPPPNVTAPVTTATLRTLPSIARAPVAPNSPFFVPQRGSAPQTSAFGATARSGPSLPSRVTGNDLVQHMYQENFTAAYLSPGSEHPLNTLPTSRPIGFSTTSIPCPHRHTEPGENTPPISYLPASPISHYLASSSQQTHVRCEAVCPCDHVLPSILPRGVPSHKRSKEDSNTESSSDDDERFLLKGRRSKENKVREDEMCNKKRKGQQPSKKGHSSDPLQTHEDDIKSEENSQITRAKERIMQRIERRKKSGDKELWKAVKSLEASPEAKKTGKHRKRTTSSSSASLSPSSSPSAERKKKTKKKKMKQKGSKGLRSDEEDNLSTEYDQGPHHHSNNASPPPSSVFGWAPSSVSPSAGPGNAAGGGEAVVAYPFFKPAMPTRGIYTDVGPPPIPSPYVSQYSGDLPDTSGSPTLPPALFHSDEVSSKPRRFFPSNSNHSAYYTVQKKKPHSLVQYDVVNKRQGGVNQSSHKVFPGMSDIKSFDAPFSPNTVDSDEHEEDWSLGSDVEDSELFMGGSVGMVEGPVGSSLAVLAVPSTVLRRRRQAVRRVKGLRTTATEHIVPADTTVPAAALAREAAEEPVLGDETVGKLREDEDVSAWDLSFLDERIVPHAGPTQLRRNNHSISSTERRSRFFPSRSTHPYNVKKNSMREEEQRRSTAILSIDGSTNPLRCNDGPSLHCCAFQLNEPYPKKENMETDNRNPDKKKEEDEDEEEARHAELLKLELAKIKRARMRKNASQTRAVTTDEYGKNTRMAPTLPLPMAERRCRELFGGGADSNAEALGCSAPHSHYSVPSTRTSTVSPCYSSPHSIEEGGIALVHGQHGGPIIETVMKKNPKGHICTEKRLSVGIACSVSMTSSNEHSEISIPEATRISLPPHNDHPRGERRYSLLCSSFDSLDSSSWVLPSGLDSCDTEARPEVEDIVEGLEAPSDDNPVDSSTPPPPSSGPPSQDNGDAGGAGEPSPDSNARDAKNGNNGNANNDDNDDDDDENEQRGGNNGEGNDGGDEESETPEEKKSSNSPSRSASHPEVRQSVTMAVEQQSETDPVVLVRPSESYSNSGSYSSCEGNEEESDEEEQNNFEEGELPPTVAMKVFMPIVEAISGSSFRSASRCSRSLPRTREENDESGSQESASDASPRSMTSFTSPVVAGSSPDSGMKESPSHHTEHRDKQPIANGSRSPCSLDVSLPTPAVDEAVGLNEDVPAVEAKVGTAVETKDNKREESLVLKESVPLPSPDASLHPSSDSITPKLEDSSSEVHKEDFELERDEKQGSNVVRHTDGKHNEGAEVEEDSVSPVLSATPPTPVENPVIHAEKKRDPPPEPPPRGRWSMAEHEQPTVEEEEIQSWKAVSTLSNDSSGEAEERVGKILDSTDDPKTPVTARELVTMKEDQIILHPLIEGRPEEKEDGEEEAELAMQLSSRDDTMRRSPASVRERLLNLDDNLDANDTLPPIKIINGGRRNDSSTREVTKELRRGSKKRDTVIPPSQTNSTTGLLKASDAAKDFLRFVSSEREDEKWKRDLEEAEMERQQKRKGKKRNAKSNAETTSTSDMKGNNGRGASTSMKPSPYVSNSNPPKRASPTPPAPPPPKKRLPPSGHPLPPLASQSTKKSSSGTKELQEEESKRSRKSDPRRRSSEEEVTAEEEEKKTKTKKKSKSKSGAESMYQTPVTASPKPPPPVPAVEKTAKGLSKRKAVAPEKPPHHLAPLPPRSSPDISNGSKSKKSREKIEPPLSTSPPQTKKRGGTKRIMKSDSERSPSLPVTPVKKNLPPEARGRIPALVLSGHSPYLEPSPLRFRNANSSSFSLVSHSRSVSRTPTPSPSRQRKTLGKKKRGSSPASSVETYDENAIVYVKRESNVATGNKNKDNKSRGRKESNGNGEESLPNNGKEKAKKKRKDRKVFPDSPTSINGIDEEGQEINVPTQGVKPKRSKKKKRKTQGSPYRRRLERSSTIDSNRRYTPRTMPWQIETLHVAEHINRTKDNRAESPHFAKPYDAHHPPSVKRENNLREDWLDDDPMDHLLNRHGFYGESWRNR